MSEPEEPKTYAIRPTERATRDVEAALSWLSEHDGTEEDPTPEASVRQALAWFDAYEATRATLANFPSRCPLVPERAHFSQETRHLIFRRSPDATPWRILFSIEDRDDGPVVWIRHVRHGARRPLTPKEAREILLHD
ncbi:type II toxin-antitoxin system RelE/ParE family toxin [Armatimonas sp.]|uniref:type II toxin-antitoxin system RelE/ParE family toxin n=1 Tax=Armatimonas sp. TaxID=1872638 RepID=UPI00286C1029|nr:type II toxin-antitoxin system RelE/ParE family toxin [Armatimonas sp.]